MTMSPNTKKPIEGSMAEEAMESPAFEKKEDAGKKKSAAEKKAERTSSLNKLWATKKKVAKK